MRTIADKRDNIVENPYESEQMNWDEDLNSLMPDTLKDIIANLSIESSILKLSTEVRSFGKKVTIITGFDKGSDMKKITKKLKSKCATGGTVKNGQIVLQGNQIRRLNEILTADGYSIEII